MKQPGSILVWLRSALGETWVLIFFGLVYLVSQLAVGAILSFVGLRDFLWLQCCGWSSARYFDLIQSWQARGVMPFYQAHLAIDRLHWIWYTVLLMAAIARALNASNSGERSNWLLLLPVGAGLADWLENQFQAVFLNSPGFATVVDPLPLVSTCASNLKWLLVAVSIAVVTLGGWRA
ncbi:MAG: hypothetical protein GXY83_29065 [Rhodopirellula sp.]|nr:hypothetical protein [Rhodopirellula sp.]